MPDGSGGVQAAVTLDASTIDAGVAKIKAAMDSAAADIQALIAKFATGGMAADQFAQELAKLEASQGRLRATSETLQGVLQAQQATLKANADALGKLEGNLDPLSPRERVPGGRGRGFGLETQIADEKERKGGAAPPLAGESEGSPAIDKAAILATLGAMATKRMSAEGAEALVRGETKRRLVAGGAGEEEAESGAAKVAQEARRSVQDDVMGRRLGLRGSDEVRSSPQFDPSQLDGGLPSAVGKSTHEERIARGIEAMKDQLAGINQAVNGIKVPRPRRAN